MSSTDSRGRSLTLTSCKSRYEIHKPFVYFSYKSAPDGKSFAWLRMQELHSWLGMLAQAGPHIIINIPAMARPIH